MKSLREMGRADYTGFLNTHTSVNCVWEQSSKEDIFAWNHFRQTGKNIGLDFVVDQLFLSHFASSAVQDLENMFIEKT